MPPVILYEVMVFKNNKYFSLRELRKMGAEIVGREIFVSRTCRIYAGAKLCSPCYIAGSSSVGKGCELLSGCRITDSVIGAGSILESCKITSSQIGENCTLGPFCNVRAGCKISSGCKIGDFVELKASTLGENCKAAHLAYIGDAELGKRVNIGCGVVFANYDGRVKRRTYVGDNAFIGCNSVIIAPAHIGDGAYVAAGTYLSGEIPQNCLAISRAALNIKDGGGKGRYLND